MTPPHDLAKGIAKALTPHKLVYDRAPLFQPPLPLYDRNKTRPDGAEARTTGMYHDHSAQYGFAGPARRRAGAAASGAP